MDFGPTTLCGALAHRYEPLVDAPTRNDGVLQWNASSRGGANGGAGRAPFKRRSSAVQASFERRSPVTGRSVREVMEYAHRRRVGRGSRQGEGGCARGQRACVRAGIHGGASATNVRVGARGDFRGETSSAREGMSAASARRGAREDFRGERPSGRARGRPRRAFVAAPQGDVRGDHVGARGWVRVPCGRTRGRPRRTSVWAREETSAASIRGEMSLARKGTSAASTRRGARGDVRGKHPSGQARRRPWRTFVATCARGRPRRSCRHARVGPRPVWAHEMTSASNIRVGPWGGKSVASIRGEMSSAHERTSAASARRRVRGDVCGERTSGQARGCPW